MWRSSSAIAVYEGEFLRACLPGRISEKTDPLLLRGRPISTRIPVAKGGNLVSLVRARGFSRDLRGKRANAVGGWQIPDKGLTKKKKTSKKQQKKKQLLSPRRIHFPFVGSQLAKGFQGFDKKPFRSSITDRKPEMAARTTQRDTPLTLPVSFAARHSMRPPLPQSARLHQAWRLVK